MATTTKTKPKITLKLLVNTNTRKVLFAEAGKDFVDFLFGLLELPLGTILALLVEHGKAGSGSLCKIYDSVKTLDDNYLQSNEIRESLLRPKITAASSISNHTLLKLNLRQEYTNPFHQSPNFGSPSSYPPGSLGSFSSSPAFGSSSTPAFGSSSTPAFGVGSSPTAAAAPATAVVEGYVKGVVTYMVMDDLEVKPMSTISSISFLSSMRVQNLSSVEEKTVEVDLDKGLKLMRASFESTTVLTDVFLPTTYFSS